MRRAGLAVGIAAVLVAGIAASQLHHTGGARTPASPAGVFSARNRRRTCIGHRQAHQAGRTHRDVDAPAPAGCRPHRPSAELPGLIARDPARTHDGTTMIVQVLERSQYMAAGALSRPLQRRLGLDPPVAGRSRRDGRRPARRRQGGIRRCRCTEPVGCVPGPDWRRHREHADALRLFLHPRSSGAVP